MIHSLTSIMPPRPNNSFQLRPRFRFAPEWPWLKVGIRPLALEYNDFLYPTTLANTPEVN